MSFTPAIIQYLDIKKEHPDCILFFRMGDFYETFFEDAKICSKILDIVLTSKNKNSEHSVPMAGIPYHSAEKYITKLVNNGYKIAIAEQTSQPIPGKIVERAVVNIITPWTYIQETKKEYTTTMAVTFLPHTNGENYHLARGDFSIGEYRTKSFPDIADMQKFILSIKPIELIFDSLFPEKDIITEPLTRSSKCLISLWDLPPDPEKFLVHLTHVQQSASYGKALESWRLETIALLFSYLTYTQKHALANITRISFHSQHQFLILDDVTIKNLEILTSTYEGNERYSLFHILDSTQTSWGSRLLRHILTNPIKDITQLQWRLDMIDQYRSDDTIERISDGTIHKEAKTKRIRQLLSHVRDIPKLVSSILYKKTLPNTFIKLRATLRIIFGNSFLLEELTALWLSDESRWSVQHLFNHLEQILKNDDEYHDDIDFIRDGYQDQIDELRKIAYHSDDLLMQYQQELAQIAWIPTVKARFIINQWYFLEVTNKDIEMFEKKMEERLKMENWGLRFENWGLRVENGVWKERYSIVRRNTLKWGQRYSSPYLENLETDILKAKDNLRTLEFQLLHQAQQKISEGIQWLHELAEKIARLDLFVSQALLSQEKHFSKPEFIPWSRLTIVEWRHPVIEKYLPLDQQFIPNDLQLNYQWPITNDQWNNDGFLHIITGPNMWGKSTYLRQNALIVLMAHCGLFVPAKECRLGIVDAIFARIGSGDIIAKNQSTFMTEMIEVANILNNASKDSFIIFDELGRWTATYDGLALTKAILEHLVTTIGAKTLIATHYHELIQLENTLAGVKNFSVSVYETDKEVIFMKKIVRGWASKSYGLDVAKLAWIPATIVEQAKKHLNNYEWPIAHDASKNQQKDFWTLDFEISSSNESRLAYEKIKSLLESYNLNNITPLQALQLLDKIKDELK